MIEIETLEARLDDHITNSCSEFSKLSDRVKNVEVDVRTKLNKNTVWTVLTFSVCVLMGMLGYIIVDISTMRRDFSDKFEKNGEAIATIATKIEMWEGGTFTCK